MDHYPFHRLLTEQRCDGGWPYLKWGLLIGILGAYCLGQAQGPIIMQTYPAKSAERISCSLGRVTARVKFSVEGKEIDPRTIHNESVRLWPKGMPESPVLCAQPYYEPSLGLIILPLRDTLLPLMTYNFEVNEQLTDDRGFSFTKVLVSFSTGQCNQDLPLQANPIPDEPEPPIAYPEEKIGLPFEIIRSTVSREQGVVKVSWQARGEGMIDQYWIERAVEEKPYRLVDTVLAMGAEESPQTYHYIDENPQAGFNTYRILVRDLFGDLSIRDSLVYFKTGLKVRTLTVPQQGELPVELWVRDSSSLALVIQSEDNEKIVKRRFILLGPGEQVLNIPLEDLPPGNYVALLRLPTDAIRTKFEITPQR